MRNQPNEIQSLLKNLLINVTNFFRDKEAFQSLEAEVIPKIFEGKSAKDTVRVWSCGCASGEEPFSLAMLLQEHADKLPDPPKIQMFASDVDDDAISEARLSRYPESIEADVSPERLKRFFTKEGKYYSIKKELRETVLFAPHNVLRDPPFSRLDLVACRNLLIYLNRDTQEKVLQIFHFALSSSGYLFLGSSETADNSATMFSPVDKKHRIYARRNAPAAQNSLPVMPVIGRWEVRLPERKTEAARDRAMTLSDIHYRLLENYAPSSILINQDFDIVYLSGTANRFLRFTGGEPSRNLLKAVVPDLLPDLRAALFSAQRDHRSSEFPNIRVRLSGEEAVINLIVRTVAAEDKASDFLLVIFEEKNSPAVQREADHEIQKIAGKDEATETIIRRLEDDLQRTKEQLRLTIEQHETTVEEHRAGHEELQATIEELRSASEELETSKEELQSVNEELTTVNHELKDKIDETGRINSDLQNLMAATDIATIFLDKSLKIKRYTPPVEDFFNITHADIGRPLEHFTHKLNYDELARDAAQVLRKLIPVEKEISDKNNRHYLARFAPYRTIDDRIDGIVLNFIDITERRRSEREFIRTNRLLQATFDSSLQEIQLFKAVREADSGEIVDFEWLMTNKQWNDHWGERAGRRLLAENPAVIETGLFDLFKRVTETGVPVAQEQYYAHEQFNGWFWLTAAKVEDGFLLSTLDIDELKRAERQREFSLKLSDALRPLSDANEIETAACRILGEQLGAHRVYYVEIFESDGTARVRKQYLRDGAASIAGDYTIEAFDWTATPLRRGEAVVVADVYHSDLVPPDFVPAMEAVQQTSIVLVPLIKEGVWTGVLTVGDDAPRDWKATEVELARETLERMWAAAERARAEEALGESEEKYRTLFDSIDEGYLIGEVIFDENDKPVDILYLDANPAAARLAGRNFTGRRLREIDPDYEDFWYEIFGRVALTGESLRAEHYAETHGRWFDFYAFKIGGAETRRVAGVFQDTTERKQAEERLRASEEKYRTLFETIDEGFCVQELVFDKRGKVVDIIYRDANRAFEHHIGRGDVVGKRASEIFPQIEPHWFDALARVHQTGVPERTEGYNADTARWLTAHYSAVGGAGSRFIAAVFNDITERKERERQQEFLLKFSDALRAEKNADNVANRALLMLSEQMNLDRCYIGIYRLEDDRADLTHQVGNERVPPLPDAIRLSDFPEAFQVVFDRTLVIEDFAKEEGLSETDRQNIAALGLRALVAPCLRRGENHPLWSIVAVSASPRRWTQREISLIEAVTERTWAAIEHARTEEAVSASEQRLQRMVNVEGVGVFTFDYEGVLLHANDAFLLMVGFTRGELEAQKLTWRDFTPPEYTDASVRIMNQVLETGRGGPYEKEYYRKDGSRIWLMFVAADLGDGTIGEYAVDISERKRVEEALRESEERLRIAVEAAEMATWDWDLVKGEVLWNERHFTLFGMKPSRKPLGPEAFSAHVHPEDRDWVVERLKQAVETNTTFTAEFRAVREDGAVRWMEGYGHVVEQRDGKPVRMSGVMSDITSRRRAEQAVRQSEERLRLILESITDYAVITSDPDGIINGWNTGAENTFGWTAKEAVGQSCALIFTPEDRADGVPGKELRTAYETGVAEDTRWHIRKDGTRFFASGTVTPIRNGEFDGFVKITSDQTARIAAETALREKETLQKLVQAQEDERERIARDLHDELGQQLVALRIKLDAVSKNQQEPVLRNQLYEIQDIARSIDDGVDFLAWELRPSSLDDLGLTAALDNYIKQWSRYAGVKAELRITNLKRARFAPEVETCIYRIVQEALNNTHKHAKATNADVILEKRGETLVLIIEDNGIGFSQKSKKNRARGIGVTGMKERAQLVGGTLEIETAPKQGTTIFVRIPFSAAKEK